MWMVISNEDGNADVDGNGNEDGNGDVDGNGGMEYWMWMVKRNK